MEVAWTTAALCAMGRWDRYTRDAILTECYMKVKESPDSFGEAIPDSEFLSTAVQEKKFFVFSEIISGPEEDFIVVRAITRKPLEDKDEVIKEIARLKAELPVFS